MFCLVPLIEALLLGRASCGSIHQSSHPRYLSKDSEEQGMVGQPGTGSCDVSSSSPDPFASLVVVTIPCDLDGDLGCDCADIDLISGAIGEGSVDDKFDLNADGVVNSDDREFLILDLIGVPYGDVNFDGQFSSQDLLQAFQAGHYDDMNPTEPVSYCEGDWNGDTVFDSSDLVFVFQQNFTSSATVSAASVVPEPGLWTLSAFGVFCLLGRRAPSSIAQPIGRPRRL
jgi:hypothetical protein